MGHLMDVSVELQYLFYPLHQMHNVWLFVPFPYPLKYVLHDKILHFIKSVAAFTSSHTSLVVFPSINLIFTDKPFRQEAETYF